MKKKSLMYKSLTQFIVCVAILLLLATPLFYWLTKSFYAEDMIDIIEAVQQGKPVPALDLEEDILHGIMIQFARIGRGYSADDALHLRPAMATVRQDTGGDRTFQAGKRSMSTISGKRHQRICKTEYRSAKADDE